MILKKNIFVISILFCISSSIFAQNTTPLFIQQNNGTNIIIIKKTAATTLNLIAKEYNVSEELLSLFNAQEQSGSFAVNQPITVPLTETNFIKDKLVASNSSFYKPLYHQSNGSQSLADISKIYLLPVTKLLDWNKMKTSDLSSNTQVLVGWIRTSDLKKNTNTSTLQTGMKSVSNSITDIGTGSKKVINKVGDGLQKAGKNIQTAAQKINFNNFKDTNTLAYSAENVDTISLVQTPLVYQLGEEAMKPKNVELLNKTGAKIKSGFQKAKNSITDVVGKGKDKGYEKEQKQRQLKKDKELEERQTYLKNKETFAAEEAALLKKEKANEAAKKILEPKPVETESTAPETIYDLAKSDKDLEESLSTEVISELVKPKPTNVIITRPAPTSKEFKAGKATWFYVGSTGGSYYVFTNYAPKGTMVKVWNNKTNEQIDAKVLGSLTVTEVQAGHIALISENAKVALSSNAESLDITIGKE